MKADSEDKRYNELIKCLRDRLEILSNLIKPKIYQYGFLQ